MLYYVYCHFELIRYSCQSINGGLLNIPLYMAGDTDKMIDISLIEAGLCLMKNPGAGS